MKGREERTSRNPTSPPQPNLNGWDIPDKPLKEWGFGSNVHERSHDDNSSRHISMSRGRGLSWETESENFSSSQFRNSGDFHKWERAPNCPDKLENAHHAQEEQNSAGNDPPHDTNPQQEDSNLSEMGIETPSTEKAQFAQLHVDLLEGGDAPNIISERPSLSKFSSRQSIEFFNQEEGRQKSQTVSKATSLNLDEVLGQNSPETQYPSGNDEREPKSQSETNIREEVQILTDPLQKLLEESAPQIGSTTQIVASEDKKTNSQSPTKKQEVVVSSQSSPEKDDLRGNESQKNLRDTIVPILDAIVVTPKTQQTNSNKQDNIKEVKGSQGISKEKIHEKEGDKPSLTHRIEIEPSFQQDTNKTPELLELFPEQEITYTTQTVPNSGEPILETLPANHVSTLEIIQEKSEKTVKGEDVKEIKAAKIVLPAIEVKQGSSSESQSENLDTGHSTDSWERISTPAQTPKGKL